MHSSELSAPCLSRGRDHPESKLLMLKGRLAKATLSYSLQRQALVLSQKGFVRAGVTAARGLPSTSYLLALGPQARPFSCQKPSLPRVCLQ